MQFFEKHKNDLLLIFALLLLAGGFWLWLSLSRSEGALVEVRVKGEVQQLLPLDSSVSLPIGEEGRLNLLVIEEGGAYMSEASCPDHVCLRRGTVRYAGETIVCLPNEVVVTVLGGEENEFDAVSG